jgi:hypothetical protein
VGQAKRRHVLRYLAARERAGIIGTGPFDLDEALVRLDARLVKGCRWALAVAVELALTGQRPGCKTCAGVGTQPSRTEVVHGIDGRSYTMGIDFAACRACRGSGHNTSAQLPWPAWLRRKGGEFAAARLAPMREHTRPHWATRGFEATCENEVERRVETRTRSFARGAHRIEDPWFLLRGRLPTALRCSKVHHHPAWLVGERRHLDQRRERARRAADKARQARRASDPVGFARQQTAAYTRELSGSWTAEGPELERWHAGVRDQADALGYAVQQQRISGNSLGLADRLRVPLDLFRSARFRL